LLQIAVQQQGGVSVWILDLQVLSGLEHGSARMAQALVNEALEKAFRSIDVTVLGFAIEEDFKRLVTLTGFTCFGHVEALIDLNRVCDGIDTIVTKHESISLGLNARLKQHTKKSLDKTMQCSDWMARPLSTAQIAYAAADAASLIPLYDALLRQYPHYDMNASTLESFTEFPYESESSGNDSADKFAVQKNELEVDFCILVPYEYTLELVKNVSAQVGSNLCKLVRSSTLQSTSHADEIKALCFVLDPKKPDPKREQKRKRLSGRARGVFF
jgi:hypothetical protein